MGLDKGEKEKSNGFVMHTCLETANIQDLRGGGTIKGVTGKRPMAQPEKAKSEKVQLIV